MAKISLHGNNSNLSTGGLTATVNWPDGTSQTSSQQTIQVINSTNSTTYDVKAPIIFSFGTPINLVAGLVTNICPAGQTFNYVNQTTNVNAIGITGIQSFDTDISTLSGLVYLFIGGYYNSTTWNGIPTTPINENIYLTSFTTILPNSTSDHFITITKNQLNITTFNPTYTLKTNRLTFTNNPGQTSPITIGNGHAIDICTITNNSSLQSVTVNSTGVMRTIDLNSNVLTNFTINGLNLNTTANKSVTINLEYNQLSTLPVNCISSYPPLLNSVSVYLKGNKFSSFNYTFTGPNMSVLELDNQSPAYSQLGLISDVSTENTTFKTINFQNNNVARCPILPVTLTSLNASGNPIFAEPNRPNLTPGMINFRLNRGGGPSNSDLSSWAPDVQVSSYHTPISNISTFLNFEIDGTTLPSNGWTFQFSNSIAAGTTTNPSSFVLTRVSNLTSFDMSYIGSFRSCTISTNSLLTQLDNLTTRSLLKLLDIRANKFPDSSKIIPNTSPWPSSLYSLKVDANSSLTTWSKSFATFNTSNNPASYLSFNNTQLSNNSIAFIVGNLVTATTLTNGTLIFSASTANFNPVLNNPDPATVNCLNCLTATTSTPCVSPATGNGRNWTVRLRIT